MTRLKAAVMAVAALDLPHISSFCSVPQASLTTLLDAPTADLVQQLLSKVLHKANDFQGLQSENLRLSVESEAVVRGNETKTKVLKSQLEKSHKELATFQQKLQEQGKALQTHSSEDNLILWQRVQEHQSNLNFIP